jgi:hypothetical protein
VSNAAKLAVPQQPECSDFFAAIQTAHDRYPAYYLS